MTCDGQEQCPVHRWMIRVGEESAAHQDSAPHKVRSALGRGRHRLQLVDHTRPHNDASLFIVNQHVEHLNDDVLSAPESVSQGNAKTGRLKPSLP